MNAMLIKKRNVHSISGSVTMSTDGGKDMKGWIESAGSLELF